jgi:hypothetical protein
MHGSQMIYAIAFIVLQGCDPALTALFTPIRPVLGQYEVCTTDKAIEEVAEPGWTVEKLEALDAFGAAGSYDRSTLAQLYGGTRAKVARGWKQSSDRFESITLISPYPNAALTRLEPGTMTIRWIIRQ